MGSSPSKATVKAMQLLISGRAKTARHAAKLAGIHHDTIYRHQPYKTWKAEQKKAAVKPRE